MSNITTFRLLVAAAASLLLNYPLSVSAQIEEIVVTAQKRAESLQDVPISIDAFSGDEMNQLGVKSAHEVLKLIPNAGTVPQGGAKQNFFIRGVGTADFHLNVVGAVGVFLDDVSLNSPFSVSFAAFDMERAEVLRGPQNTLFGRNTTGGAVNFISRKPNPEDGTNGYIRGGFGSYSQFDIEAAVGFRLSDTAAVRIAGISNTRDGVFDSLSLGQEVGDEDRQAFRAQLSWQPTQSWDLLFKAYTGSSDAKPFPFKNVGFRDPADVSLLCSVPVDQLIPANNPNCADSTGFVHQYDDWEHVYNGLVHTEDLDVNGFSLRADWSNDAITFTSITALDYLDVEYKEDSDGGPTTVFQFYQEGSYDQWSQEFRLASADDAGIRWIAGVYYFFEDAEYSTAVRRTPAPFAPSGTDQFNIVPNTQVQQDNSAFSVFGQLEFDLRDDLTLTAGYRWTNETKEGTNAPSVRCVGTIGGPPFCPSFPEGAFIGSADVASFPALFEPPAEILDGDWDEWGARVALDYQMTDSTMLFGSISRGFKGGGFSIAALQALLGLAAQDVEPETLWAYEIGMKSDWMEETLRFNAAVFYYDWEGLQSFQVLVDPNSGEGLPQLTNVPEASLLGAEAELTLVPGAGWYLQAGLGLLNSEIDDPGNIAGVSAGNDIPNTPELTFTGLIRKEFELDAGILALQTNFRYRDDVTYDLGNAKNLSQEGFWNVNARGIYTFGADGQYEVNVWGENLTGEKYCIGMTSLAGLSESNLCLPNLSDATFGIGGAVHFN